MPESCLESSGKYTERNADKAVLSAFLSKTACRDGEKKRDSATICNHCKRFDSGG